MTETCENARKHDKNKNIKKRPKTIVFLTAYLFSLVLVLSLLTRHYNTVVWEMYLFYLSYITVMKQVMKHLIWNKRH